MPVSGSGYSYYERREMGKYQVWIGGTDIFDCVARNKRDALEQARDWYCGWTGEKRLPSGTGVCEISPDHYQKMVEHNRAIGIDITNM